MVAVERESVYWDTVNVTQALVEMIAVKVFVLFCAASVGNISMGNVSVIQVGRARNAVLGMMNVRFLTAMVMVTVSMGSALVSVDIWESSVRKWTAPIPHVLGMVSVLRGYVYARRVGKVQTVARWTAMPFSVSQTAQVMAHLTLRLRLVTVNPCGQEMTAPESCVILTVGYMVTVLEILVCVMLDGLVNTAA